VAVLDLLLQWANNTERNCSVYWLYGPAGAGKSAIAQTIAEHCAKEGQLAASFFFSRGKVGCDKGKYLFPTISYQLAISVPGTRKPIGMTVYDDR
jgi:Parvovirus non-structural protein NS1